MCKHKYRKVNNDAVVLKVEEKKGYNIKKTSKAFTLTDG
jgi:hypothetical protein